MMIQVSDSQSRRNGRSNMEVRQKGEGGGGGAEKERGRESKVGDGTVGHTLPSPLISM